MLAAAIECQNPLIFNFGDSNSDTGGYAASYGVFAGYPTGRKFFHRTADRFSDGRIILDFYCDTVKAEYMSSYFESLTPNFKTGVNFAVGNATILRESNFFNLHTQLTEFHARSLILHSEGIKSMFGEDDFRNAVYLIDIGQNDITGAFSNHSQLEVLGMIPSFINGIKAAIEVYMLFFFFFLIHLYLLQQRDQMISAKYTTFIRIFIDRLVYKLKLL
nr:GDSL esterase/lipase LIP-4-like [Ipomoea batatas]